MLIKEQKGKILNLTLNRPKRGNSLDPLLLLDLRKTFIEALENEKIRAIMLTGTGEKDFCTGIDINSVKNFPADAKINLANVAGDIATLIYYGKPTVIAINGRTMGMGVVFSCAADYRIMIENNLLQMPEVNFGIFPGASCIALMTRTCGTAWTRRILMTGLPINSNDAFNAHITDEIVSRDELVGKTEKIAKELSLKNPVNLKAIKFAATSMHDLSYMQGIHLESDLANWYQWSDPKGKFREFIKKYNIKANLTGNPDKLQEDYEKYSIQ